MSKANTPHEDAGFEMIELAIDDVEQLTKAFELIQKMCAEMSQPAIELDDSSEVTLH